MKKLISVALLAVMLFSFATAAQAKTFDVPMQGMTMEIPDNFEPLLDETTLVDTFVLFKGTAEDAGRYEFAMSASEKHEQLWLDELSEDELEQLFAEYSVDMHDPVFEIKKSDALTWMVISSTNGQDIVYVTLIYGSLAHIACLRIDDQPITDEEIAICEQMAMSLKEKEVAAE